MIDDRAFTSEEIEAACPEILKVIARATDANAVIKSLQDVSRKIDNYMVMTEIEQFRKRLQSVIMSDIDIIAQRIEGYAKDNSLNINIDLQNTLDLLLDDLSHPEFTLKKLTNHLNRALQESIEF